MMPISTEDFYDFIVSMSMEILIVIFVAIAFVGIRMGRPKKAKYHDKVLHVFKRVHAEAASGNAVAAVDAWQSVQAQHLTPPDTLKLVVQAFLDAQPSALVSKIVEHFSLHKRDIHGSKAAVAALEVVASVGNIAVMDDLYQALISQLRMPATGHMQEVLLGGYAAAGNELKVQNLVKQLRNARQKVTMRGYSLMVKGFLKNGMLDASLKQLEDMHAHSVSIPSFAIPELFRVARESRRADAIFDVIVGKDVVMTPAVVTSVLEECLAHHDFHLAKKMEQHAKQTKVQLNFSAYEALLKLYATAGDLHAIELFAELQQQFTQIGEGFCVSLMVRCAESKFLQLAENIVSYLRARGKISIIVYSALMKVYSFCNMYKEACNLYQQLTAEGLEPDSMMYGCLMRFSAECGRTDLTRELSAKVPEHQFGIHHHMSMIRAAGQDKDVIKAFTVLDDLRAAGVLDTLICNAVLDVCCSLGEMDRANKLASEMTSQGLMDTVSYNTLLKGYCMLNDSKRAKDVIREMETAGLQPNDVSYNCLINIAASAGDFGAAWKTIETMESKAIRIDHYTLATLMKALKRAPNGRQAIGKVLDLLDRHRIDVCREEVLLNTALEACMKHGEHRRLANLLDIMNSRAGMQLAPHTYANLIKSSGTLKRVQRCRELWKEMTEVRNIEPTGVALGCMLDALVCNGGVVEGVALLRQWEDRIPVNTVIYSTLIKGFINIRDTKGAVEMWHELRSKNLPMNVMVYNAIIDVHARQGATKEVSALLKSMDVDGVQADDVTKSLVAKSYCMTGELDTAVEVFRSLPAEPNANTVIVFNTILDGCTRHNRMELADELLAKMESYRIEPSNFTLGIIVKMWGRRGQISKALAAVKTLPKKFGFTPNGPVKTCLFFACLRNDAIDSAFEVFEDLRATGHPVDAKIFSALVNNCAKFGRCERAVSLVEEAYGLSNGSMRVLPRGENLEPQCMEHLMKSLTKHCLIEKYGAPLVTKMMQARVPVGSQVLAFVQNRSAHRGSDDLRC